MIKNLLKSAVIALFAIAMVSTFTACTTDGEGEHNHTYDDGVTLKASTCGEEGLIQYSCTGCDHSYTRPLDLKPHQQATEWSSDEGGHWKATVCGHEVDPIKEKHYYSSVYYYDTLYHWKKCQACGYSGEVAVHEEENGFCTICGCMVEATEGLDFQLSEDGQSYILKGRGSAILEHLVVPAKVDGKPVTEIATGAFESTVGLIAVSIPDSVQKIGADAFKGCASLAGVVMGDGVKYIGLDAFAGTGFLSYNKKGNLKYLGNQRNPYHAIISVEKTDIVECDIQSGTKVVADGAFSGCTQLVKVNVLDLTAWSKATVTNAQSGPFVNGAQLYHVGKKVTDLVIPASVNTLGQGVYAYANITSVNLNGASVGYASFMGSKVTSAFGFGETVGAYAFYLAENLTSVDLNGAKTLGSDAFAGCTSLSSLKLDGVETVGENAFFGCEALSKINIPASVTSIGHYAFRGCVNATELTFEGGVTSIGEFAFGYLGGLHTVILPEGLTSIDKNAFAYCSKIKNIVIPASVNEVGAGAFASCTELTVFMEAEAIPSGFDADWNAGVLAVVLGGQWSMVDGLPVKNA